MEIFLGSWGGWGGWGGFEPSSIMLTLSTTLLHDQLT